MRAMRIKKSKISWYNQKRLIDHFVVGTLSLATSKIWHINRNTVWLYFNKLRRIIVDELEKKSSELFSGEIEVDESYFARVKKRKKRKRG